MRIQIMLETRIIDALHLEINAIANGSMKGTYPASNRQSCIGIYICPRTAIRLLVQSHSAIASTSLGTRPSSLVRPCKSNVNMPQRVICHEADKMTGPLSLQDNARHHGRNATIKIPEGYWWPGLYRDTTHYIRSCDECQRRINVRIEEELYPNLTSTMWQRVHVD